VVLYIYSRIRLHGGVLNYSSTGKTLPLLLTSLVKPVVDNKIFMLIANCRVLKVSSAAIYFTISAYSLKATGNLVFFPPEIRIYLRSMGSQFDLSNRVVLIVTDTIRNDVLYFIWRTFDLFHRFPYREKQSTFLY
jgi:hypothetical protein